MNRIEGYSAYQMNLYENQTQRRKSAADGAVAEKTSETQSGQTELSDGAQKLLKELKEKYKDMDFMVAKYDSDEEAASYLSRGTKEYSVLIDPETLEKMAADKGTKQKYMNILDNAKTDLSKMKDQLADEGKDVTHIGISINSEGKRSYFADLEKMSDKQAERIEKNREEKKAEKAAEEKKKKTRVHADSIEELREKIRNIDWDQIKAEDPQQVGSRYDYSI